MKLSERSTADLVVLLMAVGVVIVLVCAGAALTILAIFQPERDLKESVETLSGIIGVALGAVVGYLAGRGKPEQTAHEPLR